MLPKIKSLITRSTLNIQLNDVLLNKKEGELRALSARLTTLKDESGAIIQLTRNLHPSGEINKDKLFALQRRQSALKRKLADIKLQSSQIELTRENCEKEKLDITQKRKGLLKKMGKYQYLQDMERKKKILKDARMEEYEIEEKISWQR